MDAYIKYFKVFVILLWSLAIWGTIYFVIIDKEPCEVFVSGKCYSQANLNSLHFVVPGIIQEGIKK